MAKIERTWPGEDFDSISIDGHDCNVEIQGRAGERAEMKGDFSDHRERDLIMDCSGQPLKYSRSTISIHSQAARI